MSERRRKRRKSKSTIILAVILAIVIIGIVGYNIARDYTVDFIFDITLDNLKAENDIKYKLEGDKIVKDFEDKKKKIADQKNLTQKEKLEKLNLLKAGQAANLKQIEEQKKKDMERGPIKIPEDVKQQMMDLAVSRLGADGVSRCMAMLSDGLTQAEKAELKQLFYSRFSAGEQKQIREWAAIYAK